MLKELFRGFGGSAGSYIASSMSSGLGAMLGGGVFTGIGQVINLSKRLIHSSTITEKFSTTKLHTSIYGKAIPVIFGKTQLAGNMIWCSPIVTNKNSLSSVPVLGKMASMFGTSTTTVTIRVSLAIAICQGIIDSVDAIYADGIAIDLSKINYVVYTGTEDQEPNSTIQSYMKAKNTPAFKGLAYIVLINFHLEDYNGRIPNFTFDVTRSTNLATQNKEVENIANLVSGVTVIPGSGYSVYDTITQYKYDGFNPFMTEKSNSINCHTNNTSATDFVVSMNQLKATLPNVKWVSLVVSWFSNTLDIKNSLILPHAESLGGGTIPDPWYVAGYTIGGAPLILKDSNGNNLYSGTTSDIAVVRAIEELKNRGYNVCFYPMIFINTIEKPWRGHLTGSATDIKDFFNKTNGGYNKFILHYANLLKAKVDAFIIGSELIGLTSIMDAEGSFPAVNELINLSNLVRNVMGSEVKLTYAADWSEYHHTNGGWYNLDPLWACQNIDIVGIDAYFPLTNLPHSTYDEGVIIKGWTSGEGYDFVYTNKARTQKQPITPQYAWKNIEYFWSNSHTNPNGEQTSWQPKMKKIWFTEYGFPSINCSTNQPNVFFNPQSVDGGIPILSNGAADFEAQRVAIIATEKAWLNSPMIEQKFVWTWDARPYPHYPALKNVWGDWDAWQYGHFLNGKLNASGIRDIVASLCKLAGMQENEFDVSALSGDLTGYVVATKNCSADYICALGSVLGFDGFVQNGVLKFVPNSMFNASEIPLSDIVLHNGKPQISILENTNCFDFPNTLQATFENINDNYNPAVVKISSGGKDFGYANTVTDTNNICETSLGIATDHPTATQLTTNMLLGIRMRKQTFIVILPMNYAGLISPMDIIKLVKDEQNYWYFRVISVVILADLSVELSGYSDDVDAYGALLNYQIAPTVPTLAPTFTPTAVSNGIILQLPNINCNGFNDANSTSPFVYLAIYSSQIGWHGCNIYTSEDGGNTYCNQGYVCNESIVGICANPLLPACPFVIDQTSKLQVYLSGGNDELLFSISEEDFINHVNLAIVGNEIIAFKNASIQSDGSFVLSNLLRGRFGTESSIKMHKEKESFILLSHELFARLQFNNNSTGKEILVVLQSNGQAFEDATILQFTLNNTGLADFIPNDSIFLPQEDGSFELNFFARPKVDTTFYDDGSQKQFNYALVILDENNNPLRRIVMNSSSSYTYTIAMQIEDFDKQITSPPKYNIVAV